MSISDKITYLGCVVVLTAIPLALFQYPMKWCVIPLIGLGMIMGGTWKDIKP